MGVPVWLGGQAGAHVPFVWNAVTEVQVWPTCHPQLSLPPLPVYSSLLDCPRKSKKAWKKSLKKKSNNWKREMLLSCMAADCSCSNLQHFFSAPKVEHYESLSAAWLTSDLLASGKNCPNSASRSSCPLKRLATLENTSSSVIPLLPRLPRLSFTSSCSFWNGFGEWVREKKNTTHQQKNTIKKNYTFYTWNIQCNDFISTVPDMCEEFLGKLYRSLDGPGNGF